MKKIMILSISLFFSSVQATNCTEQEVISMLAQNPALVEKCVQLSAQGLTAEQVVEQMFEGQDQQAHLSLGASLFQVVYWGGMLAALFGLVLYRDYPEVAAEIGEYVCSNSSLLSGSPLC